MLEHGEARLLVADQEFSPISRGRISSASPVVMATTPYEAAAAGGRPRTSTWRWPQDEWEAISLNYTSGTTGNPKGVVYHHRGAYLNAVGNILVWGMPHHSVYLWTLPMFHCNGWCFPWTMARMRDERLPAQGRSRSIFLPDQEAQETPLLRAPRSSTRC
jgi:fatty-acyl-CoA synthase